MATRTRVRLYKGIIEAEAEARFRADAVWAIRDGWHPSDWHWDGTALRVTYTQGQQEAAAEGAPRREDHGRLPRWLSGRTRLRRV
jgi:hypothetical protein